MIFDEIWYGRAPAPWWLTPLSAMYGAVSRWRRFAYAKGWRRPQPLTRPVIVIGNVSVGGHG